MIEFQLDTGSGVATYLQLVQQVHDALRLGLLEPGDQLPTWSGRAWCAAGQARERSSSGRFPAPTLPRSDGSSPR
jgi:hypothetical protein